MGTHEEGRENNQGGHQMERAAVDRVVWKEQNDSAVFEMTVISVQRVARRTRAVMRIHYFLLIN